MYACTHCGKLKFVPFRCHSRFCPSCGNKYSMERTTSMSFKLVNLHHRHCVFTIDENLRDFFLYDRSLLNCLFHSVISVVSRMFFFIKINPICVTPKQQSNISNVILAGHPLPPPESTATMAVWLLSTTTVTKMKNMCRKPSRLWISSNV